MCKIVSYANYRMIVLYQSNRSRVSSYPQVIHKLSTSYPHTYPQDIHKLSTMKTLYKILLYTRGDMLVRRIVVGWVEGVGYKINICITIEKY